MAGPVAVRGLAELQRDFKKLSADLTGGLHDELRHVAEPVRAEAEQRALSNISRIGPVWSQMRIGITTRAVYVAPAARRRRGRSRLARRPNLAPLLMERAMQPALDAHEADVVAGLDQMLGRLAGEHGF